MTTSLAPATIQLAAGHHARGNLQAPFRLVHNLGTHPLLAFPALLDLARELPREQLECGPVDAAQVVGFDYQLQAVESDPAAALSDPARRSTYLKHVETVPRYRALVAMVIEQMLPILGVDRRDVRSREGYVFVSGAASVTPAHVDHECNFLLVAQGRKRVWISEVGDPAAEQALEAMHTGRYGTCGELPTSLQPFDLGPGEGVFIPPRAAHFVENHAERCIALSTVFGHRLVQREVAVYAVNGRLRLRGHAPSPPGRHPAVDVLKRTGFGMAKTIHRGLRSVARDA